MSLAAVKNDAMAIRKRLLAKKQQLCTAAPAASAFGGSAYEGRLYALSQRRFQGTLKLAPHAVTRLADIPGSAP